MPPLAISEDDRPRLLLVEDDAPVRRALQLLLQSRGYAVRAYRSGAGLASDPEALRAECLIADLRLPEGDALRLLDGLREAGWGGRAVLISGNLDADVEACATSGGYDLILAKPIHDSELTDGIARLISNAPSRLAPYRPGGMSD